MHFDGSNWNTYKVADSIIVGSISGNDKYLYLTTFSPWSDNAPHNLYLFKEEYFLIIDQSPVYPIKFGLGLWIKQNQIKTFADGIISNSLKEDGTISTNNWYREITTLTFLGGRGAYQIQSIKNVFAVGQWNLIYHLMEQIG